jgi:hypothetical protein
MLQRWQRRKRGAVVFGVDAGEKRILDAWPLGRLAFIVCTGMAPGLIRWCDWKRIGDA